MKNQHAFRLSAFPVFIALVLAAGLGLSTCSNALQDGSDPAGGSGDNFPVSVIWQGEDSIAAKSAIFGDANVDAVTILVYNTSGARIGSGALTKKTTYWSGSIDVSENGSAVFEANVLNSVSGILYVGKTTQTLSGANDVVTIVAGVASLLGGSIQGYSPALSAMVNTFAGSSTAGTGMTSPLIGTLAFFINPYGMTSDGTYLYIADMGSNNIRRIEIATQSVSTFAGHTDGSAGRTEAAGTGAAFITPRGITTDGTDLYVADYGNNTIRKIAIDGAMVSAFAGTLGAVAGYTDGTGAAATFHSPSGITYHNGYLYVADTANNRIRRIEISSTIVTTLAGQPDVAGTINAGFADGIASGAKFNLPQGLTTDGTYVYVADTANNRIRRISIADGTTETIAGTGSVGSDNGAGDVSTFNLPTGITMDGTYLYVTDFGSHVIRKITVGATAASTTVELLAGSAGTAGTANGIGAAAMFNGPSGIATDGTNLYISDYSGYTIRKIQ